MKITKLYLICLLSLNIVACGDKKVEDSQPLQEQQTEKLAQSDSPNFLVAELENYTQSSAEFTKAEGLVVMDKAGWLVFEQDVQISGRYKVEAVGIAQEKCQVWLEDYIDNTDGRTYNVTGNLDFSPSQDSQSIGVDGSPFKKGKHRFKVHTSAPIRLDKIQFSLIVPHQQTPTYLTQNTEGKEWKLVWADEFENPNIDTTKWTYDIGNWGWGNNELQYYTQNRTENARIENGSLVIEARKNDMEQAWTSARLTTRGKVSFLYGKIEFRAKVPKEKGNWAAAWTLGDSYVDEIDWPYCGEIDILESVGYEINEKGDGIAHATVHTPAYYFKINNQISSTKDIKNIVGEFHTYAVEWTPKEVKMFVDGQQYYLYDKNANEKEFPFNKAQNIILNLAMGGGWGGAKGMDEKVSSQKFIIDYVRVYEKK